MSISRRNWFTPGPGGLRRFKKEEFTTLRQAARLSVPPSALRERAYLGGAAGAGAGWPDLAASRRLRSSSARFCNSPAFLLLLFEDFGSIAGPYRRLSETATDSKVT